MVDKGILTDRPVEGVMARSHLQRVQAAEAVVTESEACQAVDAEGCFWAYVATGENVYQCLVFQDYSRHPQSAPVACSSNDSPVRPLTLQ